MASAGEKAAAAMTPAAVRVWKSLKALSFVWRTKVPSRRGPLPALARSRPWLVILAFEVPTRRRSATKHVHLPNRSAVAGILKRPMSSFYDRSMTVG